MQASAADALAAFQGGDLARARALAEWQLEGNPASPQLLHLLGLIHCREGDPALGSQWLRRAVDAEPENVPFRVMLARALIDSGRPRDALEAAIPPEGSSPPELALWHARAEAASATQAWPEAADAWQRLCSARVGGWRAWAGFAEALEALGRWRDAAVAWERAVALSPADLQLRRNLAGALNNARRLDESVEEFRRCIAAAPADRFLRISLAAILGALGRDEESWAEIGRAAQLVGLAEAREDGEGLFRVVLDASGGVDLVALRELAGLLERSNRTDALDRLLADAESRGIAGEQVGFPAAAAALRRGDAEQAERLLLTEGAQNMPLRWHWLMARIADALGQPERAFAETEAMNRAVADRDAWRTRASEHLERLRRGALSMTPEWAAQLPRLPRGDRQPPAFLVGFPRSGTTLLDTFLMGHPDAIVLEEVPIIRAIEPILGEIGELPQRSVADLERARAAYFAELERHADPAAGGVVIDKLPLNILAVPLLHCLFPDAPIIFAQRHPCDCVLSCLMQAFDLNSSMACFLDLEDAAALYDVALTIWTRSNELLPLNARTVVYEQLIETPEAELRPVVDILGLEWRDELLDHRTTAKARGAISTPSYSQVTQPLNRAARGRWRRYEQQLQPALPLLLPWAERLGYGT